MKYKEGTLETPRRSKVGQGLRLDLADLRRRGLFEMSKVSPVLFMDASLIEQHNCYRILTVERENPEAEVGNILRLKICQLLAMPGGYVEAGEQTILCSSTRPHFGGRRWWFRCPHPASPEWMPCGRSVRVLYCPDGYEYLGCRECHRTTYPDRRRRASELMTTLSRSALELVLKAISERRIYAAGKTAELLMSMTRRRNGEVVPPRLIPEEEKPWALDAIRKDDSVAETEEAAVAFELANLVVEELVLHDAWKEHCPFEELKFSGALQELLKILDEVKVELGTEGRHVWPWTWKRSCTL